MLSRIGEMEDSRMRKKDFDNTYIPGLEKMTIKGDCGGGSVRDACETRRVFAPLDCIPDSSQREGKYNKKNVTNAEGEEEGMEETKAKMLLPSAGKPTEVQNPIPLNFSWSNPTSSVADRSHSTNYTDEVKGKVETATKDRHKVWAAQRRDEPYKTDYQANYQWHLPMEYDKTELKTFHIDDNNITGKIQPSHQKIQPESFKVQLESPTKQNDVSQVNELLPMKGEEESYKIDSTESEKLDADSTMDMIFPDEGLADSKLLSTPLTKETEDVMDKGTMTSKSSDVTSNQGDYNEKLEIGDNIGDEVKEITATGTAPFLIGSAQQQLTTNDHVIDGTVDQHSSSSESEIFPRAAYNHFNYGSAPHILPTFHKRAEEDNVARLLCTPGYSTGRGSRTTVCAAYLCRLHDAIDQSKYLVRTSEVVELCRLQKPPISIVKLFYGICRILGIPRMKWKSLRMFFLRNRREIVQAIHNLDIDSPAVNADNLAFCSEQWAQISNISKASSATHCVSTWLHLLYKYTRAKDGYIDIPSPFEATQLLPHAQTASYPSIKRSEEPSILGSGKERPKAVRLSHLREKAPTGSRTTTNTPVVVHNNKTSHDGSVIISEGFNKDVNDNNGGKRGDEPEEENAAAPAAPAALAAPDLHKEEEMNQSIRQIQAPNMQHNIRTTPMRLKTSSSPASITPTQHKRGVQNRKQIKTPQSYNRSKSKPSTGLKHYVPKDTIVTPNKQGDQIQGKQRMKILTEQQHDHSATKGLLHNSSPVYHHHYSSKMGTTWPHYANPVARKPSHLRFNPILNNPRFPPERQKYCSEYDGSFTWPRNRNAGWTSQDREPGAHHSHS